ncbi:NAD-dependent protein deacetylase sirtuin-7 [Onthophagus taurus]|uniref:NAD-dependent protein deacetylase sirtuin-7 n=1 Tax=Onthophagus taurus TaxID=166361 RepID=UPI000C20B7FD|nr:NAD-dependent protein deacetylase sirtuin-7 [Onthophagus taurus]
MMENDVDGQNESEIEQNFFGCGRILRKQKLDKKICAKDERNASIKKVSLILQKVEDERTVDDLETLKEHSDAVEEVKSRWKRRDAAKRRLEEIEDTPTDLEVKCQVLAQAIAQSQHLVVYTGAGISTAAKIPDYRGSNGIWTRMQQGKDIGNYDLSLAEPTYTHMALSQLYRKKILKYVVSQNCDGLHLRSGLPKTALSEVHGNMYIEVCKNCKPVREYLRLFDVTENTARFAHKTMRKCYSCNSPLLDTIVHFGERGNLQYPVNWSGACKNADKATTIVCLGSSLKVLKKYPWLWQMDKPAKKRPNLYIVNLQWTPKDECANVKIHGKCDLVMKRVMELLGLDVPKYDRDKDPIFHHCTSLFEGEEHTLTQSVLKRLSVKEEVLIKEEIKTETASEQKIVKETIKYDLNATATYSFTNCDNNTSNTTIQTPIISTSRNQVSLPNPIKIENNTNVLPPKSSFTIDSILDTNRTFTNTINDTLVRYYQLSNLLMQRRILECPDLLYYPLYTNFLYSGIHSIINPSFYPNVNQVKTIATPECKFCHKNYESFSCLFYTKSNPEFLNVNFRDSKIDGSKKPNVCVCCDYSTEEEDVENCDDVISDKIQKLEDPNGSKTEKKVQAGWFGKGYKKNRRLKKR